MIPSVRNSQADDGEIRRVLSEQYAARHTAIENYVAGLYVAFRLIRRLGLVPLSWQGRLVTSLYLTITVLLPPVVVTTITGQWATAPLASWIVVAIAFGFGLGPSAYTWFQNAANDLISLYRVMLDERGLRRLITWDRRWFSLRAAALAGSGFVVAMLTVLTLLARQLSEVPIPAGTVALGAVLIYQAGENAYHNILLGAESRIFSSYDYDLYDMSPIESVAMRRSLRGYNQMALLSSVLITLIIIGFVVLLPAESDLALPIGLILLLVVYLGVAFGTVQPRRNMERVIRAKKEQEMETMQRRINASLKRLSELSADEYEEMRRIEDVYDKICDSSENLLPLTTIGRTIATLLLPTITVLVTTAGEAYLSQFLERLLP